LLFAAIGGGITYGILKATVIKNLESADREL
jgi:hypothetical protein